MSSDGLDLRRARRADTPPHPRPPAGRGAAGEPPGRAARRQPARRLQAPAGAAGGGPGRGPTRRPAAPVPGQSRAARGDRRVARALPAPVGRPARRARAPPRRDGGRPMTDGTIETRPDGTYVLRYERRLRHPIERVWAAITEPDRIEAWLARAELDLTEGGRVHLEWLNTDEDGNRAVADGRVTRLDPPRVIEYDIDIHGLMRW